MKLKLQIRRNEFIKNNVFISLIINLIFIVLVICFCDMKYEVSDDYIMDAVLSGAFGNGVNPYLIFSNVMYGLLLKPLYLIFPTVSWYFVFQLLICYFSLCAVTYVILERNHIVPGIVLSVLFVTFFSDDLYLLMQFTKTAAIATSAGGVLLLHGVWQTKVKVKCVVFGGILAIVGAWIRFSCVYISLLFLAFAFVGRWFEWRKEKEVFKLALRSLAFCVALILIAFLFKGFDENLRKSKDNYANYMKLNSLRAGVTDNTNYGYDSIANQLQQIGLDNVDYYMLNSWNLIDRDVYTDEVLETFSNIEKEYHTSQTKTFKTMIKRFVERGYQHYTIVFGLFIIIFLVLFLEPKKIPWVVLKVLVTGILLLYFFYRGRVVYRVEYSIFVALAVCRITSFKIKEIDDIQKRALLTLCGLLGIFKIPLYIPDDNYKTMNDEQYAQYIYDTMNTSWDFKIEKYRCDISHRQPQANIIKYIEQQNDNYYLLEFNSTIQLIYLNYKPWERIEEGVWEKYYYLGSVTFGYPDNDSCWGRQGIDTVNPNKSLVDENVYVVARLYVETKLDYLRKYYYPDARAELVDTIDGFGVWKYYIK